MADGKSKTKEDRKLGSGETYEVAAFAEKYGISHSEAATIIKRYGPSRRKLDSHMASRQA